MFEVVRLDAHNPSPMTGSGNHTYLIAGSAGQAALVDAGVGDPSVFEGKRSNRKRRGHGGRFRSDRTR